jgi:AraC family transcriptional regulator
MQANVLMFNVSPVQGLRQTREGRSFESDMLHGEMTLMPRGVPSQWWWNSACDRLDVLVSADVFGDGSKLEVVNRFLFRDSEMEAICHRLYREVSLNGMAGRLYVESLVTQLAVLLLRRHSTASGAARIPPSGGLTRNQARRVLDYIESNLSRELTLSELAGVAGLSLHHFARMFKRTMRAAPVRAGAPGGTRQRDAAHGWCEPGGNQLVHGLLQPEPLHQHLRPDGGRDASRIPRMLS